MAGQTRALSEDERAKTLWQVARILQQPDALVTLRRTPITVMKGMDEGHGMVPTRLAIIVEENPPGPCQHAGPRGVFCELDAGHAPANHRGRKSDHEGCWTVEW